MVEKAIKTAGVAKGSSEVRNPTCSCQRSMCSISGIFLLMRASSSSYKSVQYSIL